MMFLSGIYFPLEQLPSVVRANSQWLPLTSAVGLARPMFMDQWPTKPLRHVLILPAYATAGFWLALALTRKRFRG